LPTPTNMIGEAFADVDQSLGDIRGLDLLDALDGELDDIVTHFSEGAEARSLSPMLDNSPPRLIVSPIECGKRTQLDMDCKDTEQTSKKLKARVRFVEPLRDDSDYVIDIKDSRLASVQRNALRHGRSTCLSWRYSEKDEMQGAFCDGVWFGREELLSLSTLSS